MLTTAISLERSDKGKADISEKDKQALLQIVQSGDVQKLKDKLKELDIDTISGITLPSNAPYMSVGGSWLHVASTSKVSDSYDHQDQEGAEVKNNNNRMLPKCFSH